MSHPFFFSVGGSRSSVTKTGLYVGRRRRRSNFLLEGKGGREEKIVAVSAKVGFSK